VGGVWGAGGEKARRKGGVRTETRRGGNKWWVGGKVGSEGEKGGGKKWAGGEVRGEMSYIGGAGVGVKGRIRRERGDGGWWGLGE